ncbi:MAG: hypothetical protein JWP58_1847 [Hymenobacter sp.]|nr:hypothetical protein [Hymenobacter sp.]
MTAPAPTLLLRVAATWPLPGLGLLALPDGPTPHLTTYELHAAVAVEAVLPDGARHPATATVEEITRGAIPERGLLLDFGASIAVPDSSEIWLARPQPSSSND